MPEESKGEMPEEGKGEMLSEVNDNKIVQTMKWTTTVSVCGDSSRSFSEKANFWSRARTYKASSEQGKKDDLQHIRRSLPLDYRYLPYISQPLKIRGIYATRPVHPPVCILRPYFLPPNPPLILRRSSLESSR